MPLFMLPLFFSVAGAITCDQVQPYEMLCTRDSECNIDVMTDFTCYVFPSAVCTGERNFSATFPCRFCYQVEEYECEKIAKCTMGLRPAVARCKSLTSCMGPSIFRRQEQCKQTSKSQKVAFIMSLFLGGFGGDRFYLDHSVTAVFKMLTFGGLGFVYMIDLFLIAMGALGPADGSMYAERL